jgi:hypothetical protein
MNHQLTVKLSKKYDIVQIAEHLLQQLAGEELTWKEECTALFFIPTYLTREQSEALRENDAVLSYRHDIPMIEFINLSNRQEHFDLDEELAIIEGRLEFCGKDKMSDLALHEKVAEVILEHPVLFKQRLQEKEGLYQHRIRVERDYPVFVYFSNSEPAKICKAHEVSNVVDKLLQEVEERYIILFLAPHPKVKHDDGTWLNMNYQFDVLGKHPSSSGRLPGECCFQCGYEHDGPWCVGEEDHAYEVNRAHGWSE